MKPLRSYILLEPIEQKQDGIIIPDSAKEKSQEAKVIDVGKDVKDVSVGDVVIFKKFSATHIEDYAVVDEEDILCIKK